MGNPNFELLCILFIFLGITGDHVWCKSDYNR